MEFARPNETAIRIGRRSLGGVAVVAITAITWFSVVNPAEAHTPKVKAECYRGEAVLLVELSNYNDSKGNNITVRDGGSTIRDARFGRNFREIWSRPGNVDHTFTVQVRAWDDPRAGNGFSFTKTLAVPSCAPKPKPPVAKPPAPKPPAPKPPVVKPPVVKPPVATTTTTTTTPPPAETTSSNPIITLPPVVTTPSKEKEKEKEPAPTTTTTGTTTTTTQPTTTTKRSTPSFDFTTTTTKPYVAVGNETDLPNTGASIAIPALVGLCLLTAGGMVLFSARQRKRGRHAAW